MYNKSALCDQANMSVHAARALVGWRTSSGSCRKSMEGGENHESPRCCIEVNVPRGGRKLAVLQLHHGATPTEGC